MSRPEGPAEPSPPAPLPLFSLLTGLAAVLLAVAVVGVTVTGGLARYSSEPRTGPPTSLPGAGPAAATAGDPLLDASAVRADFAGDRDDLAPLGALGPWDAVAGSWAQADGRAALRRAGGARSLVLVHPAVAPRIVQVALATVETNAGLVVGYRDPSHYLVLVAVPAERALWLAAVDGDAARPTLLAIVHDAPLQPGVVIGLRLAGGQVTIVVDGKVVRTLTRAAAGTGFGLTSGGAGSPPTARFDDLVVQPG